MNDQFTIDDVRAMIVGGDGFCSTYGSGLAMALNCMTSTSRDLRIISDALAGDDDHGITAQVVNRVSEQLDVVARLCYRVASTEGIVFEGEELTAARRDLEVLKAAAAQRKAGQ